MLHACLYLNCIFIVSDFFPTRTYISYLLDLESESRLFVEISVFFVSTRRWRELEPMTCVQNQLT